MNNNHDNSNNTHNSIHAENYVCDVHVHLLLHSAHMDATKLVAAVHAFGVAAFVRVLACQAGGRGFKLHCFIQSMRKLDFIANSCVHKV